MVRGSFCRKSFLFLMPMFGLTRASFNDNWLDMQYHYKRLQQDTKEIAELMDPVLTHDHWKVSKKQIQALIEGPANQKALLEPSIRKSMVFSGWGELQKYQLLFLDSCISQETRKKLELFKDVSFGGIPLEIVELNCSANSLLQLCYAISMLEMTKNDQLKTIVEFGGGYGALARIFKQLLPDISYVVIDLPEVLALQYLFLRTTLSDVPTVMHTKNSVHNIVPGAINLVPVYFLDELDLQADGFISTFALSEAAEFTQKKIIEKKFFSASYCYMTGQIDGWKNLNLNFVKHDVILDAVRSLFSHVRCNPHPINLTDGSIDVIKSYEVQAYNESCKCKKSLQNEPMMGKGKTEL